MQNSLWNKYNARMGLAILSLAVLWTSSGCQSFNFNRQYNQALATPPPPQSIQGPWVGEWRSKVNGHHGQLRCLLTLEQGALHQAWFKARFFKIMTYSTTVPLEITSSQTVTNLTGSTELGWLAGGHYSYQGHVSPDFFYSTYSNKWDHGTYRLFRPTP